ncbi:Rid family hydrolase [Altererythrobacter lauratis]|uniref:Rid family hydrolase n=1 Tax=Alteraurantiacibacter lauratis TaxID=2054627 RepID=A0ABV7EK63_9SPHN
MPGPVLLGKNALFAAISLAVALPAPALAQGEITRIKRNPAAIILEAARVNAGADVMYVSGQLPTPLDPAMPMSEVTSLDQMGDTRQQTISTLARIEDVLATEGFTMADVVKLNVFVKADPRIGAMDFAGMNAGFREFFGTEANPNTTARSTFEVAGLVGPYFLIEIDAIAARAPQGSD